MIHWKGKNKPTEIVPEKEWMADLLDKDFNTTIFQDAQRTEEKCGGSQENNVQTRWKYHWNRQKIQKGTKRNSETLKRITIEMENPLEGFKSKFKQTE